VRTSNRLRERCTSALIALASIAAATAAGASAASCTNDNDILPGQETDASTNEDVTDGSANEDADAGAPRSPFRDAATSDAAPEPVVCESSPCAVSLTTTGTDTYCVLLEDKTVACWGANLVRGNRLSGDLGRGPNMRDDSADPARVVGLTDIRYLNRGCAIDGSGATWCWGTGPYLQSTTTAFTTEPVPVKLPIPAATSVSIGFYRQDTVNYFAVGCATVQAGLICWGTNGMGHLGPMELGGSSTAPHEARTIALPPGAPIESIVVGQAAFAVRSDGTVLSWGRNPPLARISSLFPDPYPRPAMLNGISRLEAFRENACAVAQGIAYCWGGNPHGSAIYGMEEPMKFAIPKAIATPEPVVDIATHSCLDYGGSMQHGCAVGVSGALYCWGENLYGQVGDGTREYALSPVKVTGLPGRVSRVKTTRLSTCALLTTGKVHCWGDNRYGQLGNGDIRAASTVPQEVLLP